MLNAGVLKFDSQGRISTILADQIPRFFFNGGTPTGTLGSLVVAPQASGFNPEAWLGGFSYTNVGALVIDSINPIINHVGGLPLTEYGLATDNDVPASYVTGIPLSAAGRVCVFADTPLVLKAFSNAFSSAEFD
jgi:hypothetical protein